MLSLLPTPPYNFFPSHCLLIFLWRLCFFVGSSSCSPCYQRIFYSLLLSQLLWRLPFRLCSVHGKPDLTFLISTNPMILCPSSTYRLTKRFLPIRRHTTSTSSSTTTTPSSAPSSRGIGTITNSTSRVRTRKHSLDAHVLILATQAVR